MFQFPQNFLPTHLFQLAPVFGTLEYILYLSALNFSYSGSCPTVRKGSVVETYRNWGDVFSIEFDIVVNKLPRDEWMNVFHFTATNDNCCNNGDRIHAFWVNRGGYFYIISSVNNEGNYQKLVNFVLGKIYRVTIRQVKEGSKYFYEIIVDGKSELRTENRNPKSYPTVRLYRSDPWYDNFSPEFGSICNVKIQQQNSGGKFLPRLRWR